MPFLLSTMAQHELAIRVQWPRVGLFSVLLFAEAPICRRESDAVLRAGAAFGRETHRGERRPDFVGALHLLIPAWPAFSCSPMRATAASGLVWIIGISR